MSKILGLILMQNAINKKIPIFKHLCTLFLIFCSTIGTTAQNELQRKNDIPVEVGGNTLQYAWAGGVNNPQFSAADLNNDGILDMVIFDRAGNNIITLINGGTPNEIDYTHDFSYEANFPSLKSWAVLTDYTCDGIADIFTSFNNVIRVYEGYFNTSNELAFTLATDTLFHVEGFIAVSEFDIPAIVDVDYDGDTDILTFNTSGGFIELFANQSVQNGTDCGTLEFARETECWGELYESGVTMSLDLFEDCGGLANGPEIDAEKSLHPGSTLLAIDLDGDMDREIILGDINFDNLVMASNGGDIHYALMTSQDTLFPAYTQQALMTSFPAAFSADVNNDGLDDMLVSPNSRALSKNFENVFFYENNGNTDNFYTYRHDSMFIQNMIDVNRTAHPTFFDHNSDGLLDLVVGNHGYADDGVNFTPALALYENIGTANSPAFRLINRNYMDVSNQLVTDVLAHRPTFGDIDGDGDQDMIIGDNDGYLHFFRNEPDAGGIANLVLAQERFQNLDIKQFSTPQLVDVTGDGLLDLIVGQRNGEIHFLENTGTATAPIFVEITQDWGNIDVQEAGVTTGYAVPFVLPNWDDDPELELIVGAESGKMYIYEGIEASLTGGDFTEVTSDLLGNYMQQSRMSPAIADLDNNGLLDMVVGTFRGGLLWYEQSFPVGIAEEVLFLEKNPMQLYPNPAKDEVHIHLAITDLTQPFSLQIKVLDVAGRVVLTDDTSDFAKDRSLNISDLAAGVYFVQVVVGETVWVEKMVVE